MFLSQVEEIKVTPQYCAPFIFVRNFMFLFLRWTDKRKSGLKERAIGESSVGERTYCFWVRSRKSVCVCVRESWEGRQYFIGRTRDRRLKRYIFSVRPPPPVCEPELFRREEKVRGRDGDTSPLHYLTKFLSTRSSSRRFAEFRNGRDGCRETGEPRCVCKCFYL